MGASIARCDAPGCTVAMSKCQRACGQCNNNEIEQLPNKLKLCNWFEEEIHHPGLDPNVGMDYGILSLPGSGLKMDSLPSQETTRQRPLYAPGSLVNVVAVGDIGWQKSSGASPSSSSRAHAGATSATAMGAAAAPGAGSKPAQSSAGVQHLKQEYDIDPQPCGRGSYGEVHGATHRRTGVRRAIKSVEKAGLKRYVNNVSEFVRREVDILRRLDHPHIVRLYEAVEDESTIYLVLEMCEGGDLLERVAVARERLPEREAAVLLSQMLGAVQHLYLRGIVHRDLKPENFLFSRREPEREPLPPSASPVKLIDFGLSRRLGFEAGMRITPKIGTTEYMAPEAYAGRINAVLADRLDMWSIGVVLHVIFIGHFPSPRLAEQTTEEYLSLPCWSRVSATGRDLLGQMLRQEPTQRPTVIAALKHPWLQNTAKSFDLVSVSKIPQCIQKYSDQHALRRLALCVTAKELDESEVSSVRKLYQMLELECDGALTKPSLERVSWLPGPLGSTAAELARHFDAIDLDGSHTIDWTELLAATLGPINLESSGKDCATQGCSAQSGRVLLKSAREQVHKDACWAAFDLMSQGGATISGDSLMRLLSASSGEAAKTDDAQNEIGPAGDAKRQRHTQLNALVRAVNPSGAVDRDKFGQLMQGLL